MAFKVHKMFQLLQSAGDGYVWVSWCSKDEEKGISLNKRKYWAPAEIPVVFVFQPVRRCWETLLIRIIFPMEDTFFASGVYWMIGNGCFP